MTSNDAFFDCLLAINLWYDFQVFLTFDACMAMVCVTLNFIMMLQHVPRINGEIPSIDEVTSDHQRLLDRYYISWHISAYVSLFVLLSIMKLF